jgi:hypothetical protein
VRVGWLAAAFVGVEVARYGAFLASWLVLGRAVLAGPVTAGTIGGWAAALALSLGCAALTVRLQAALVVLVGGRLRARLLGGLLAIQERARDRDGSGLLLGRSFEVETVEDQLAGAALRDLGAPVDLVLAALLLGAALGPVALMGLAFWLGTACWAAYRYAHHRRMWTVARLRLGAGLTAKLAGHRTRAVQQPPRRRHDGEAAELAGYAALARPMDRWRVVLSAGVPRGFALTGVVVLAVGAGRASQAAVAAGAAGVLFTTAALTRAGAGLAGLADARAGWLELRTLTGPAGSGSVSAADDQALPPAERNHLLLAPLAMNVLLGRRWPATEEDLVDAERVCREVGLGGLLDRMPGGLAQVVGETGWQLSAGERSLVFLARALLRDQGVPVPGHALDALDPATRAEVLAAIRPPAGRCHR